MELNSNQYKLLCEISKQTGRIPALKLCRRVYQTAVSGYNNITLLRDIGLICLHRRHNKNIAELTKAGRKCLTNVSKGLYTEKSKTNYGRIKTKRKH